jgi:hypothetical protein
MAETYRTANRAGRFGRPSGASQLRPPETQGCARRCWLHPGLFSMLPPGAGAELVGKPRAVGEITETRAWRIS